MLWNASVLSTVSSDTEPSVVITFDSAKYIFNVGENTTRAFLQSRQNWRKTKALFLTSVNTQRASGLPGLLMTFADAKQSQVHVAGPAGLLHYMASMRRYTYRDNLIVTPSEIPFTSLSPGSDDEPVYQDKNISVFALPIVPEGGRPHVPPFPMIPPSPTSSNEATSSLKRKREVSPDQPSKRPSNSSGIPPPSDTVLSAIESLRELMVSPGFEPVSLSGELAQAWRHLVVQTIFPGTQVASTAADQDGPSLRKGKRKAEANVAKQSADVSPKSARVSHPPGLHKSLPIPERALVGSSDPSLKPTVAYAIVGPRIRGKFDEKKAVALGLKRGPLRARLSKGHNVTVQVKDANGNTVDREIKPEDCIGESVIPGVVLLLDAPTVAHIPGLLSGIADSGPFAKYRWKNSEGSKDHVVRAIFHLCGEDVLEDVRYKSFMNEFGPDVHHIVASRKYVSNPITFTSAAHSQLRLNHLDPEIFPKPQSSQARTDVPGLPVNTIPMRTNMLVSMHPPGSPEQDPRAEKYDLFHPAVSSDSPLTIPESTRIKFTEAQAAVQASAAERKEVVIPGRDVLICPLGTGSAMPTIFRNVSGILIHIPDHGYILLDAGEGTWGQLVRNYGEDPSSPTNVWHVLRQLRCIFISHMHGDHHIGLSKILAMRQQLDPPVSEPLYVVGNYQVFTYLCEYAALEDLGLEPGSKNPVVPILAEVIHWQNNSPDSFASPDRQGQALARNSIPALRDLCASLGLQSLRSVDVAHRTTCHGVILKHMDGWSIVYSGDTIPTHRLVEAGYNATLLIHEATMADDQAIMAGAKMHSTVGQAIDIGKGMKARHILLTHFSARYPTMPPSVMTKREAGDPTLALAFDHANIKIGNMWKMNAYMKAIEQNFIDLEDDGGDDIDTTHMAETDIA
ncbi:hypothetical protein HYDPIDRAFT_31363 [Hydnomerulius pinastri MD-312]|uniref:ribonuclease Z n=1 Tax=Hydnomerulius pinastri MD-312 TaxID=994086 RepID=A0A0C9W4Q5_9AGAM|nr:hypothetical protein HYDPIDRAFT_31363 [Hydnomerulius pinastri MD-312]